MLDARAPPVDLPVISHEVPEAVSSVVVGALSSRTRVSGGVATGAPGSPTGSAPPPPSPPPPVLAKEMGMIAPDEDSLPGSPAGIPGSGKLPDPLSYVLVFI